MAKLGKLLTVGALVGCIIGGNALAATSSTTISSTQSSASGSPISVSLGNITTLNGYNNSSSTNNVYIQKIKDVTGPDSVTYEYKLGPGTSAAKSSTTESTGAYYVGMNPEGALSTGVNGSASLVK